MLPKWKQTSSKIYYNRIRRLPWQSLICRWPLPENLNVCYPRGPSYRKHGNNSWKLVSTNNHPQPTCLRNNICSRCRYKSLTPRLVFSTLQYRFVTHDVSLHFLNLAITINNTDIIQPHTMLYQRVVHESLALIQYVFTSLSLSMSSDMPESSS